VSFQEQASGNDEILNNKVFVFRKQLGGEREGS
jgi:hypothetical protein